MRAKERFIKVWIHIKSWLFALKYSWKLLYMSYKYWIAWVQAKRLLLLMEQLNEYMNRKKDKEK